MIHTVGPVWHGGSHGERELLISCYRRSMQLAEEHGCKSVAFPLISAGVYGYPKEQAFKIAYETISEYLNNRQKAAGGNENSSFYSMGEMTAYIVAFDREIIEIASRFAAE